MEFWNNGIMERFSTGDLVKRSIGVSEYRGIVDCSNYIDSMAELRTDSPFPRFIYIEERTCHNPITPTLNHPASPFLRFTGSLQANTPTLHHSANSTIPPPSTRPQPRKRPRGEQSVYQTVECIFQRSAR